MVDNRKIIQKKIYDENGSLECTVIPNYVKNDCFMTKNEIKYYKVLIMAVAEIREKYNYKLEIFPQVALNRIIRQNNRREKELEKNLFGKSIDFVLYDKMNDEIYCCIELDGHEHKTDPERIKRDKMVNKALKGNVCLIRQDVHLSYNKDEIIKRIIERK